MKKCYVSTAFSVASRKLIAQANEIIDSYMARGFSLTLRQLYYQFVSRDLLANQQSEYKRLGSVINDARLAGLVDWAALEDRTRNLRTISSWANPADIVSACASQFATDWWADQPYYVECWVEKDALIGVLEHACEPWQVPYFSCRGYTSASEVWGAAQRIGRKIAKEAKQVLVLHLGDHDPSGRDMTRDIVDRLRLFIDGDGRDSSELEVRRIALNMDQVDEYAPPPNPAKLTDSRAAAYIEEFGDESWELDALSPETLTELIQSNVNEVLDKKAWKRSQAATRSGRAQLAEICARWHDVVSFIKDA